MEFRAAYWTDGQSDVLLTLPEMSDWDEDLLLEEAIEEASREGLDRSTGWIEIGTWEDGRWEPVDAGA